MAHSFCCSYYCPSGTHSPLPCPAGTYNPFTAQGNVTGCVQCIAGQACTKEALTEPDEACAPGHYCPIGTVHPTDNDCPAGTYTNFNNLTRSDQCDTCPATMACPAGTGGVSNPPVSCGLVRSGVCWIRIRMINGYFQTPIHESSKSDWQILGSVNTESRFSFCKLGQL